MNWGWGGHIHLVEMREEAEEEQIRPVEPKTLKTDPKSQADVV